MSKIERVRALCKWLIFKGYASKESELAEKLGYTKSSFSQILGEKVPLSDKFIKKLCSLNDSINLDWLLIEEGEMLKSDSVQEELVEYNRIDPVGKRLTEYAEKQGISIKEFATICDIGYNNTTSLLKGRLPLGMNVLHKIKNGFPNLNAEWVLYGNGDMEINEKATISAQNNKELEQLEQINYLLSNTIKDKEKTISSLENQIALMEKLQEVTKTEESPIKSGVAR
jgi:transcriptional regulator with XRE-family HTH domain